MRCEALTAKGVQCKHSHQVEIPNVIGGGFQRDGIQLPWKYARPVHLCAAHDKKKVRLIHEGFAQPYNKYGYGCIVLDRFIEFDADGRPIGKCSVPEFWKKEEYMK